jgi:glutathione S-transferase
VLDALAHLLGEQSYFVGDALTLADILLAPQIDFLRQTPEWPALAGRHDNLRQWIARMQARPSMTATTWERVATIARAA